MQLSVRLTALATLCTACVSTNAAVLDRSVSYQKICPDGVQIFTSAERVPGPYQEVALLNSSGESGWTTEQGMAHSQQQKAAQLGANGIIMGDTKEPNAGTKIIGSILGTGAERKGKAVAIFIPSDTMRVQRVCKTTPRALATPYQEPETGQAPATFGGAPGHEVPRPVAAREATPAPVAPAAVVMSVPAAPVTAPAPTPATVVDRATPGQPFVSVGYTSLPLGTNYVGDARIKKYYPLGCAAQHAIPADQQIFFQTEAGAQQDGFFGSGDC